MILTIEDARNALRLTDEYNDEIIIPLVEAIPSFLEMKTGYSWHLDEEVHPLARTTAKFILQSWFDTQSPDIERLNRTIDNLLTALTVMGKDYGTQ